MSLICGVDEAGRGPVIGPLVIAYAIFNESGLDTLSQLKVRDSKKISPKRRKHLYPLVMDLAIEWNTIEISAIDIDRLRKKMSLNQIEAEKTAQLIMGITSNPGKIIVDACDSDSDRYGKRIYDYILGKDPEFILPELVSEHKADDKYLEAGAASIIAKVKRDDIIEELKREYGDFGSGYPADPLTQTWLNKFGGRNFPDIVRKSWNTIIKKENQTKLGEF